MFNLSIHSQQIYIIFWSLYYYMLVDYGLTKI